MIGAAAGNSLKFSRSMTAAHRDAHCALVAPSFQPVPAAEYLAEL